jgi:hypothetical protein
MSATTSLAADAPIKRVAQNVFTYNQFRQKAANWLDEFARKHFPVSDYVLGPAEYQKRLGRVVQIPKLEPSLRP